MSMRTFIVTLILMLSSPVFAQTSTEVIAGETLFQACGFCHGDQGQGIIRLDAPAIAGLEPWYIEQQLHNFKNGVRGYDANDLPGQQMALITGMLRNDASIKNVAEYISNLKPGAPAPKGPGGITMPDARPYIWDSPYAEFTLQGDAAKGAKTYTVCAACHGQQAEGNQAFGGNKLTELTPSYIARQLQYFKAGLRGANPNDDKGKQMASMAKLLADDQAIADVIAYIETL
jgi:cytochrome c oxidase subunit 2